MASGTAQIQETARSKNGDPMAIWEYEAVDLRLDVLDLDAWKCFQLCHFDLVIKVANVPYDGIVLHLLHVLQCDDSKVASGRRENVDLSDHRLQGDDLESLHTRLKRTDRINLSNQNTGACS